MTVIFATNTGSSMINPEGPLLNATSNRDSAYTDHAVWFSNAMGCIPLGAVYPELWFHALADLSLQQNLAPGFGFYNSTAGRYDFFIERHDTYMRIQMWNGSGYSIVGNTYPFGEPRNARHIDIHFTTHASEGVIEFWMDDEIIFEATGLNTSGFQVDELVLIGTRNSPIYLSQIIVADEPTILWRMNTRGLTGNADGIRLVGNKIQAITPAASGTTDVSLTTLENGIATSPQEGDYVFAVYAVGSNTNRDMTITDGTTAYTMTTGSELGQSDTFHINVRIAYKKMGPTPDTFVRFGPTGSVNDAGIVALYVVRGVHQSTYNDASIINNGGPNSGQPNPGFSSPVTVQSRNMVIGASAHNGTIVEFTNNINLLDFIQLHSVAANSVSVFIGMYGEWISGSIDPTTMSITTANSAFFSNAGQTIPLKPAIVAADDFSYNPTGVAGYASDGGKSTVSYVASNAANQKISGRGIVGRPVVAGMEVKAVTMSARVRRGETGPQSCNLFARVRGVDYNAPDQAISPAIDSFSVVWENDPETSAPWTLEEANYALAGVRSRT